MADLQDLAAFCDNLAQQVPKQVNSLAIKVAYEIVVRLVWSTPVDTSTALSNWQVSLTQPITTPIGPYVPGIKGSSQASSAASAISAAQTVLARKQPGQLVYITNNTPYIMDLENGSSKQASAGFVNQALLVGDVLVKNFKLRQS